MIRIQILLFTLPYSNSRHLDASTYQTIATIEAKASHSSYIFKHAIIR